MLAPSPGLTRSSPAVGAALAVAIVGAATIAGAWFFELVIRLKPCPLCLEQRWPYYIGVPLALVVALAAWRRAPRILVAGGLIFVALVMLWGAGLGAYHAGIEWGIWTGPQDCSGPAQLGPAGGFMDRLKDLNITRCDEAAWRFAGLSLAGYNVLISVALAGVALWGAARSRTIGG